MKEKEEKRKKNKKIRRKGKMSKRDRIGKERKEGLGADSIRARFQGHITHRLISDSILPHLKKSNSLKKSAFTSPPKRQS